jgi:hypothetical protein
VTAFKSAQATAVAAAKPKIDAARAAAKTAIDKANTDYTTAINAAFVGSTVPPGLVQPPGGKGWMHDGGRSRGHR